MGTEPRQSSIAPGGDRPAWLGLLHREADGELTPAEQGALRGLPEQAEVERWRAALNAVPAGLRAAPPMPASVAATVAADIALSARLVPAPLPNSVASQVAADIALGARLAPPPLPASVAAAVAAEVALGARLTPVTAPRSVAALVASRVAADRAPAPTSAPARPQMRRNPAPLALVVSLMAGLTLLAVTSAWPNLAAGALVLRTLLSQVSPLAAVGLVLALLAAALVAWRPVRAVQWAGAGAFALSAALTLPALADVAARGDVRFGQDVTVRGPVLGNVIAVGGSVRLEGGARVSGEVVTLLGDVRRESGAQVGGHITALLGRAPDSPGAVQTSPHPLGLATAAAFRPVLGWLGSAAWPQLFVTLTGGALLLLFVSGLAPLLARRQRHAPLRALSLGVLLLAGLLLPAFGLAMAGLLGPALLACALAGVLIALGLSVSAYDAGRLVALRLRLPVPDAVGAMLGLSTVAASLSEPHLAVTLALVGGAWGAGTLLLTRGTSR